MPAWWDWDESTLTPAEREPDAWKYGYMRDGLWQYTGWMILVVLVGAVAILWTLGWLGWPSGKGPW